MKRFFFFLCCLLPLVVFATAPKTGEVFPDFARKNADGKELRLSSLKGKVVLLDFWATYCKPCKEELPILEKWQEKYQKQGLSVLTVNVDPDPKDATEYLKKNPVKLEVLFDPDDTLRDTLENTDMPALYLIDKQGKLRYYHRGKLAADDKDFLSLIEKTLSEK